MNLAFLIRCRVFVMAIVLCTRCVAGQCADDVNKPPATKKEPGQKVPKQEKELTRGELRGYGLSEEDQKWFKAIQDKHERILEQLAESKAGKQVKVERYTPEELIAAIAFPFASSETAEFQCKRDGIKPLTEKEANAEFKKAPLRVISKIKQQRIELIEPEIKKIVDSKAEMKKAKIADDEQAIAKLASTIRGEQAALQKVLDIPMFGHLLQMQFLTEESYGKFIEDEYRILQILDKSSGQALVYHPTSVNYPTFKVTGMDLTNLVDDSRFPFNRFFAVTGTTIYKTISGASKTIFEMREIEDRKWFSDTELREAKEALDPEYKIVLTKEEEAQYQAARAAHKVQKAADDVVKAQKDQEAKLRRARSMVDSGKLLLKNDKIPGARKQFEKAITEAPDSPAAKDAQKFLDELPK